MKYGYTISIEELPGATKYPSNNGLEYLEINMTSQKSLIHYDGTFKHLERAIENNYTLNLHFPFTISISDIIPTIRKKSIKELCSIIEVAGRLQVKSITIHPGVFYWFPVEKWMRKKALKRLVNSLLIIADVCEKNNVKIALENVVPIPQGSEYLFLGDNVNDFLYIFEHIDNESVGFCLDTGHANLSEGSAVYIKELGHKLINVHYHDNLGNNDNHMIVGEGNIDWPEVCTELHSINYAGPLISECRKIHPKESMEKLEYYFQQVYSTKPRL